MFGSNGYHGVGIKLILDEAGIPKIFYHYFKVRTPSPLL
ncbi:MAG: TetR/AcrR family transcriptional regulator [Thiolinea sp.]